MAKANWLDWAATRTLRKQLNYNVGSPNSLVPFLSFLDQRKLCELGIPPRAAGVIWGWEAWEILKILKVVAETEQTRRVSFEEFFKGAQEGFRSLIFLDNVGRSQLEAAKAAAQARHP